MTMKMAGVIYRAFKEGRLPKTTAEDINKMYLFVKKLGTPKEYELKNYHRDAYEATISLKTAVDQIFAGNYEAADNMVCGFDSIAAC